MSEKQQKFVCFASPVSGGAVRRESIDGIEHIVVSSHTMPDDVVMNGVLYPAEEIHKSFRGINRTLAPLGHPVNSKGQYISASDPDAVHFFHAGAYNDNAQRVQGRIRVDKFINVVEGRKSDRGRRLIDRIESLESGRDTRPIHTSTGLFIDVEELDSTATDGRGREYNAIARNISFDHDAILLDDVGAATPEDGVGMAVNKLGAVISAGGCVEDVIDGGQERMPDKTVETKGVADRIFSKIFRDAGINTEDISEDDAVEKGSALIVNASKDADDGKANKDDEANRADDDGKAEDGDRKAEGDELAAVVNAEVVKALSKVSDRLDAIESRLSEQDNRDKDAYIKAINNSKLYSALDDDDLKSIPLDKLKKMAAATTAGIGLPMSAGNFSQAEQFAPLEMPE